MTMTYTYLKMDHCPLNMSKINCLDPAVFTIPLGYIPVLIVEEDLIFYPWLIWAKLKWWKKGGYQMNIFQKCLAINVFFFNPDFGNLTYGIVCLFSYMSKVLSLCIICPYRIDLLVRKQEKYCLCFVLFHGFYSSFNIPLWFVDTVCFYL